MRLQLHIDRLALDGLALAPHQRAQFHAALERELTRMLAGVEPARWNGGVALASVSGGAILAAPGADAPGLGLQIATAIHRGLGAAR